MAVVVLVCSPSTVTTANGSGRRNTSRLANESAATTAVVGDAIASQYVLLATARVLAQPVRERNKVRLRLPFGLVSRSPSPVHAVSTSLESARGGSHASM